MERKREPRAAGSPRSGWGWSGGVFTLLLAPLAGAFGCEESSAIGDAPTCERIGGSWTFSDQCPDPIETCTLTQDGCLLTVACEGQTAFRAWVKGAVLEFYKDDLKCRGTLNGDAIDGDCGACTFTATRGFAGTGGGAGAGGAGTGGEAGGSAVESCADCQAAQCSDSLMACGATEGCVELAACLLACTTDACRSECAAPSDAAAPAAAYLDCVSGSCATECGLTPSDDPELAAAIATAAAADCDKLAACSPGRIDAWFGSVEACHTRAELSWRWEASLPGTGLTAEKVAACVEAWTSSSCEEHVGSRSGTPAACLFSGLLDNGEACRASSQCRTGFCATPDYSCGACAPLPKLGGSCSTNDDCNRWEGEWCTAAGQCARPGAPGDACDDTSAPCDAGLGCVSGVCAPLGVEIGAPCGTAVDAPFCDWGQRLVCNSTTNQCMALTFVGAGAPCGSTTSGYQACAANGQCTSSSVCAAGPADGAACDESAGLYCTWPALCTGGTCTLPPAPGDCP